MLQKAFEPTEEQRKRVLIMARAFIPHEDIAFCIIDKNTGKGISRPTLDKYFKGELRLGKIEVATNNATKLYQLANGYFNEKDNTYYPPDKTVLIFIQKCIGGWREVDKNDKQGDNGGDTLIVRAEIRGKAARKADKKKKAKKAKTDG